MSAGIEGGRRPWRDRRIVLGVTGGIAAYKAVQLARDLTLLGAEVDTILTEGARRFVAPLSFEGVTGRSPHTTLWTTDEAALHVALARRADVICVAPATADFAARAAQGRSDDLLTAVLLAAGAPVLVCPAMNHRMYRHPQTQANLDHLRDFLSYRVAGPGSGPLAHGEEEGEGRMLEPAEIVEHLGRILYAGGPLEGRRVLITAGPTREPLDPVRFLSNRSSGRMGYALARAAWRRGGEVTLISGPSELPDPVGARMVRVETAREMDAAVRDVLPEADVCIFAAAVSDYRPREAESRKIKRSSTGDTLQVSMTANPDIAGDTREVRKEGSIVVGFALETEDLLENADEKLEKKGLDFVVANDVTEEGAGFEVETNRVVILSARGDKDELPLLSKDEVAERILDRVSDRLGGDV
ncbi:MAG: bifunctional phosphopantothenoylcysteine decarboxylase/phosphopantothenate--cysteine ligase CoaBC [Longimicrobiales bacterium]|nr:bifunctional phosphopantothenoylcysteine decarboxylase/phosphopantothenate--cysteine ligase CoaBC [Longimicrobiales bacterium]